MNRIFYTDPDWLGIATSSSKLGIPVSVPVTAAIVDVRCLVSFFNLDFVSDGVWLSLW